jgi:hypothetical protein
MQYTYSHREGREGGELNQGKKGEGQQFTQLSPKYQHDCPYLQSINSDKHMPQSPLTGQFIFNGDILLWCLYS